METLTKKRNDLRMLILRSNIRTKEDVARVARSFDQRKDISRWSVDLDDWERVLKIQTASEIGYRTVQKWLCLLGYKCAELNH